MSLRPSYCSSNTHFHLTSPAVVLKDNGNSTRGRCIRRQYQAATMLSKATGKCRALYILQYTQLRFSTPNISQHPRTYIPWSTHYKFSLDQTECIYSSRSLQLTFHKHTPWLSSQKPPISSPPSHLYEHARPQMRSRP